MPATSADGFGATHDENISGTFALRNPCAFIVSEGEGAARFCDAPAAGGPYCARHRALCLVAPDSPEGRAILRDMEREAAAAPPPNVGPVLTREMIEPDSPETAVDGLNLPRAPHEDAP